MLKNILLILSLLLPFVSVGQKKPGFKVKRKVSTFSVFPVRGINTPYSEICQGYRDNQLIFISDREFDFNSMGEVSWNSNAYYNIFKADRSINNDTVILFRRTKVFSERLIGGDHTGPISIDSTGKFAVFAQVRKIGKSRGKPQLYSSRKKGNKWTKPELLNINRSRSSFSHPALTPDGKTLFFVSDINILDGKNIFYSTMKEGEWTEPIQMSIGINSKSNELFPYFRDDKLYFTSDRPGGHGGLDLYLSSKKNGKWQKAENLGNSINTRSDEFAIIFRPNGNQGFFASNRDSLFGDDIFAFNAIESIVIIDSSGQDEFTFRKLEQELANGVDVMKVDSDGKEVYISRADSTGRFRFQRLPLDRKFSIKRYEEATEEIVINEMESGSAPSYLVRDGEGVRIFRKLPMQFTGAKAFIEEDLDPDTESYGIAGKALRRIGTHQFGDSMVIYLVDESGQIRYSTSTDQFGNFKFSKLPFSESFIIKVDEGYEDLTIIMVNKDGQVLGELHPSPDGRFDFRNVEGSTINSLTGESTKVSVSKMPMEMLVGKLVSNSGSGPAPGSLIHIVDPETKTSVAFARVDQNGFFIFRNLELKDEYMLWLEEEQLGPNMKLIVFGSDGKSAVRVRPQGDSQYFVYRKLVHESEYAFLAEKGELADYVVGRFKYKNLKDHPAGIDLLIYDEDGNLVGKTKTDKYGYFKYRRLNQENYSFVPVSEQDVELTMYTQNGTRMNIGADQGKFNYRKLNSQYEEVLTMYDIGEGELDEYFIGRLTGPDGKSPKAGVEVQIFDKDENLLSTIKTDRNGYFTYRKLANKELVFKALTEEDMVLYFHAEDGHKIRLNERSGKFGFDSTHVQLSAIVSKYDLANQNLNEYMIGRFLYQSSNAPAAGIEVQVFDALSNKVGSTNTDVGGYFVYRKPLDTEYIIKPLSPKPVNLVVIKDDGQEIPVNGDTTGTSDSFVYTRLSPELLALLAKSEVVGMDSFLVAQLSYNNLVEPVESVDVLIYNEENSLIGKARTDNNGFFVYRKRDDRNYVLKPVTDEGTELSIFQANGVVTRYDIDTDGNFYFEEILEPIEELGVLADENYISNDDYEKFLKDSSWTFPQKPDTVEKKKFILYYENNSAELTDAADSICKAIIAFTKDKEYELEIRSYASTVGDEKHNLELSRNRSKSVQQFLVGDGLDPNKIVSKYFGETMLLKSNNGNWSEATHKINRRSEILVWLK